MSHLIFENWFWEENIESQSAITFYSDRATQNI